VSTRSRWALFFAVLLVPNAVVFAVWNALDWRSEPALWAQAFVGLSVTFALYWLFYHEPD
jgi:hypothetical protein